MRKKKEVWDVLIVGDSYHPVPKFVSDWLSTVPADDIEIPPSNILEFCELSEDDEDAEIELNDISWDNDRALWLTGYTYCFDSIKEVNSFMKENNYKLGDEKNYYDY